MIFRTNKTSCASKKPQFILTHLVSYYDKKEDTDHVFMEKLSHMNTLYFSCEFHVNIACEIHFQLFRTLTGS